MVCTSDKGIEMLMISSSNTSVQDDCSLEFLGLAGLEIAKSLFGLFLMPLFMTKHKDVIYRQLDELVIYFI
ncbi:hypothetical protein Plhal304r1_c037g0112801 [Plasmopara halstedii]